MREVVVLLVGPTSLPGRLEEALLLKGMFVESCEIEQASGTLLVSSPDVIITNHEAMPEVARCLRAASDASEVKLLVMAPRGEVSKLRRSISKEVTAVLPFDLPPAAVAVRVKTVIKKNSESEPKPLADEPKLSPLLSPAQPAVTIPIPTPTPKSTARRISLQVPATSLPPLRIALLDEDVTRADAISSCLRKSEHEVFLVSGRSGRARWHLLRKFSPQAIIVDESGLSQDGGAWISAFRSDCFLQPTPLVAVALESFFDSEAGVADISGLTPQLEGLGRAEGRFLTELTVGCEIEVNPSQVSFARLLSLVAEAGTPTTIEIKSRAESLRWNIVSGSAGKATLTSRGRPVDIAPAEALNWALRCSTADILIKPQERLKVHAGELIEELLHAAYRELLPPEAAFSAPGSRAVSSPESVAPQATAPQSVAPESFAPDSELPTRPVSLSQIPGLAEMKKGGLPHAAPRIEPGAAAVPPPLAPGARVRRNQGDVSGQTEQTVARDGAAPSTLSRNTPPGFVRSITVPSAIGQGLVKKGRWAGAVAVLVLVGGGLTWFGSNGDSPKRAEGGEMKGGVPVTQTSEAPDPKPVEQLPRLEESPNTQRRETALPTAGEPPVDDSQNVAGEDIWKVKNVAKMDDCDVLLERSLEYYTSRPKWEGEKIWKRARHQLLIGEHEAANRLMCQAAFIDPDGRASVGLGEYYLSHRALKTAKDWAQYGIEQRPDGARKSRELLGDILSQMGQADEAKAQWLQTMKLEPDDLPKLRSVAKTLARVGRSARAGGDASLAERLFRRAASLDEDNVEASAGLASALLKNGEPELARKWARRALSLDPSSGDALLVLGDLARDQGDIEAARREYSDIKSGTSAFKTAQERLDAL